ncbi:MAG: DNA alkylation repair protein, partial [Sphaerospermopsis sp. SIO1G2]|nr:DNA alkylation repair protein [Sphaerospermopsis sp. SIO1G2]
RWQESGRQGEKEMGFIIRHSLRTLVKQGDVAALGLLGFGETPEITIAKFVTSAPVVKVGEAFEFSLEITAHKTQNLMIDYLMTFATDGKRAGQKVFKLKQLEMSEGATKKVKKKHPMRLMTTRRLILGQHTITLQVNGQSFDSLSFELID